MEEYRINEYITLKLENNKTILYINGIKFEQCKYLLLINPPREQEFDVLDSIDEYSDMLDSKLEIRVKPKDLGISHDEEFRAHCSNLQVWEEHDYDSRLLHSNLSFPLLKKLTEVGDPLAKNLFKEEIVKRLESAYPPVIEYLINERYIDYLEKDELYYSLLEPQQADVLSSLSKLGKRTVIEPILRIEEDLNPSLYFVPKERRVVALHLRFFPIHKLPISAVEEISKLSSLESLQLRDFKIEGISESFSNLQRLKSLNLNSVYIENFSESITKLRFLEKLDISQNYITKIPDSIEKLIKLKNLNLKGNRIKSLPETFPKLNFLKYLNLSSNRLKFLPESIERLKNLVDLRLDNNNIRVLPKSMGKLKSLNYLNLGSNKLTNLPNSFIALESIFTLFLNDNKELDNYILESLPDVINNLRSLHNLFLDQSQINLLPEEIQEKRKKGRKIIRLNL